MNKVIKSPEIRRYLYLLFAAVLALLVGYGVVDQGMEELWRLALEALFGLGFLTAAVNTPEKPTDEQEEEITTIFDVED